MPRKKPKRKKTLFIVDSNAKHGAQQPYLAAVLKEVSRPTAGKDFTVYHDNWCAAMKGGACNCTPFVRPGLPGEWQSDVN